MTDYSIFSGRSVASDGRSCNVRSPRFYKDPTLASFGVLPFSSLFLSIPLFIPPAFLPSRPRLDSPWSTGSHQKKSPMTAVRHSVAVPTVLFGSLIVFQWPFHALCIRYWASTCTFNHQTWIYASPNIMLTRIFVVGSGSRLYRSTGNISRVKSRSDGP